MQYYRYRRVRFLLVVMNLIDKLLRGTIAPLDLSPVLLARPQIFHQNVENVLLILNIPLEANTISISEVIAM